MSSWQFVAMAYCTICWVLSGAIVIFGRIWWQEEEGDQEDECPAFQSLSQRYPLRTQLALGAAVLLLGPLLPLILLYCFFRLLRENAYWVRLARTHREYVFEPLHPANLPRPAKKFVDEHKPALLEADFVELGTYLLKPEPVTIHGCCLQSPGGETIAELLYILEQRGFSFNTIFQQGLVLETSSTDSIPDLEELSLSGRYYCNFVPGCTPAEGYVRHSERVAEIEQETGCRPLAFQPEQLIEILTYGNRAFGEVSYELDKMDNPPPLAVCPAGSPIAAETLLDSRRFQINSSI